MVVTIVVAITLWYKTINTLPKVIVPTPSMSSQNAFDHFLAAGNAVIDSKKIGFAFTKNHASDSHDPDDRDYSLAEKQSLVAENAGALRALRVGLTYSYQNPPLRSFRAEFPYYAKFRGLARLLVLEDETKAGKGDWNGAVNADLDAIQMGEMIPHGSPLIGDLVGIACQAIGRYTIWKDISHLNATQSEAAERRMEKIQLLHLPFADVIQEEKWDGQDGYLELMQNSDWRSKLNEVFGDGTHDEFSQKQIIRLYFLSDKTIMADYTHYMDEDIADARLPYPHKLSAKMPNEPLNQTVLWDLDQGRFRDAQSTTGNELLTVTLALRSYILEHKIYPKTLSALVPRYLSRIPDDPFAQSRSLRYQPIGKGYLLYSVGPDGVDNGGKPIFDPSKPQPASGGHDARYNVAIDSKGDMVAGMNL